ncbi:MAG: hypothetical protein WC768_00970 [Patescibacteria group bacterium]|jgi:hypothetical protein
MWIVILTTATTIILIAAGTIIFVKNKIRIRRALAAGGNSALPIELNWTKGLRHTITMYLAPVIILALPFVSGHKPTINDFFQAATIYLAINYLKMIYWK